jgi:competence protein ComEC
VVSVGVANEYGHPDTATLGRIEANGALVFRTDEDGDVVMATDGQAVQVATTRLRVTHLAGN